ncbi:hypothetical protein [Niveibacterium terrae]|uniref:hypothetical protein n=1 Tax=Niveibacterium terrae TaxID=3373598 RepID=UPI003A8F6ECA
MPKFHPDRTVLVLTEHRDLQRVLTELTAMTPEAGLREAADWIETLPPTDSDGIADTLNALASLSECVQPHLRQITASFVAASLARNLGRHALWRLARRYADMLAGRYAELLQILEELASPPAGLLTEVVVRLMRVCCVAQKLDALHYTPCEPAHWALLGRAWRLAEAHGVGKRPVRIRINRPTETTFETEYLRSVALASAALEELDEAQIDQTARLIHYVLPSLRLDPHPNSTALLWINPAQGTAPASMTRLPDTPPSGALYFGSGGAVATLTEMEKLMREGMIPTAIGLEGQGAALRFPPLLRHLIRHWSGQAPVRRHRRYPLTGKIRVLNGVEALTDQLGGEVSPQVALWDQIDASMQGVGAEVPSTEAANLLVGTMLGLHSEEGDHWIVGVLRRLSRQKSGTTRIGIELLSWRPLSARADDGVRQTRVLLLDPLHQGGKVRLALPIAVFRSEAPLFLIAGSRTIKLGSPALVERGLDYEIRSYVVGAGTEDQGEH